ncbi:MAG TPA: response regulator transcription factor [Candidatus Sulfotelmatobacter sp.]|jgi:two-component system alkaline phosphatase synthesis response regulator PhoP|nr:response regulator transcription factor [Candidatus Sulfotelmatobacter sp.]
MNEKILLVEDEAAIRMALSDRLENEGYVVECVEDGEKGYQQALRNSYDILLLDVMLPRKSGFDLCRDLRGAGVNVPILMLTARDQVVDKVVGLRMGADDYLTKPFEANELVARIEALLRRSRNPAGDSVRQYGDLRIDLRGTTVTRDGETVSLSAREYRLLEYFVTHCGITISRDELLREVWGYNTEVFSRTIDVHVGSLRQKIEPDPKKPQLILTVPGLGYKFVG